MAGVTYIMVGLINCSWPSLPRVPPTTQQGVVALIHAVLKNPPACCSCPTSSAPATRANQFYS
ncbi:hypothetical protein HaLaN_11844 [Haematococcus lacustris]|uniref:Uncharacterized protein n=1 Tax=Haematococcus lacustris TaxID=44745 RepID=A0A699ZIS0_HAELA|nr:hypothetical protein HaLaN_11844 [Haematococcus lacustris]